LSIAQRLPRTPVELARIRDMPTEDLKSYAGAILSAIRVGEAVPPEERPEILVPAEDSAEEKRQGESLWVAAQVICLGQSVTPGLVTSQSEIMTLARLVHDGKSVAGHPLMRGWHRECLGEKLAAFIRGELQIDLRMSHAHLMAEFKTAARQ